MFTTKFLTSLQKNISKNSPTILAIMAGLGTLASVALASEAAVKSKDDICKARAERQKIEQNDDADISTPDKIAICVKNYIPTITMVAATEICLYGSNKMHQKQLATLAGAYILKETSLKEYKDQVEDIVGKKKAQEIKDSIIQKHIEENPQTETNTVQNMLPNATQLGLWYDENSKRYFYSNAEYIRKAEIEANAMLQQGGFVSINDIYDMLGIERIPLGEDVGWEGTILDNGLRNEVVIEMGSALMGPDIPVGTISMDVHPTNAWLSEV